MREETSFEDASWDRKHRTAEIRRSWKKKKKKDLEMEEICGCMDSVLSRMTARLLTWSERGMSELSSWRQEAEAEESFDLVPVSMASVFFAVQEELVSRHPVLDVGETLSD